VNPEILGENATPSVLGNYLAGLPQPEHPHPGPTSSVRVEEYKGHHISITTTYDITIDGKPASAHIGVSNRGMTHTHGLPAYEFASVVDLVKAVIDNFPNEFLSSQPGDDMHGGPGGHQRHSTKGK